MTCLEFVERLGERDGLRGDTQSELHERKHDDFPGRESGDVRGDDDGCSTPVDYRNRNIAEWGDVYG